MGKDSEFQGSKMEPEKEASDVETFNPLWNNGEFMGPNTIRLKDKDDVRDSK